MVSFVKLVLATMFYVTMVGAGALLVMWTEQHHPMSSTYVSPRLCINGDDMMKTDVCSKIGKQWPI